MKAVEGRKSKRAFKGVGATRTIARKYRILLLQHERHMILRMTRRKQRLQRRPFYAKDLPIIDIGIRIVRLKVMFKNLSLGTEPLQVGQAADMVAVPVGE